MSHPNMEAKTGVALEVIFDAHTTAKVGAATIFALRERIFPAGSAFSEV